LDNEVQENNGFAPVDTPSRVSPEPCYIRAMRRGSYGDLAAPLLSYALTFLRWIGFSKLASKVSVDNADALSKFSSPNLGRHRTSVAVPAWVNLGQTHLHPLIVAIIMWVVFRPKTKTS